MSIPQAIAERLAIVRFDRRGNGICRCPVHDDSHPSAVVSRRPNGAIAFTCMVCRGRYDRATFFRLLCEATGTRSTDWFDESRPTRIAGGPKRREPMSRKVSRVYPYVDQHGEVVLEIVRFASGEPKCLPRRPAVAGDEKTFIGEDGRPWAWAGPVLTDTPFDTLYRLPDLLAAAATRMVFVTEGERDADSLADLGLVAVTNAFGAGHWGAEHSKWLAGRHVCIVEDNDEAGRRRTQDLFGSLALAGAASMRVLRFPELPNKGDVTDWLATLPPSSDERRRQIIDRVSAAVAWQPVGRGAA